MMDNRHFSKRNDPCWCGSGKKYKKCHLNRAQQKLENPHDIFKKINMFNRKLVCLHPDAPDKCSQKIIRAHTIQRGSSLSRIAENGHVLGFSVDLRTLARTNGKIGVERIGINKASTFSGFCSFHDKVTFAPVEDEPFTATDEQCFLLGYRAMCRELHQKQTAIEALSYIRTLDRGRAEDEQIAYQRMQDKIECGQSAGYRDLLDRKLDFDRILQFEAFSDISYYVIFISNAPDVLASFGSTVQFDFQGKTLQNLSDVNKLLDSLYLSSIATENGGAIVLAWRDTHSNACSRFVQSLSAMDDRDIPDAMVRFIFEHSENTFFRPSWWYSLDIHHQSALINRISSGVDPNTPRRSSCLMPDGNHYVNWSVVRRQTNRQI